MPSRDGFQSFVNNELPPAVPGDFAGANIRTSVLAGHGKFVAPPGGTNVGFGGWGSPESGYASNYYQPGAFAGFVHREAQALLTTYLQDSGITIPGGDMVTLLNQGDFWGTFASGGSAGQKVYFNAVTGALTAAATGGSVSGSATATTVTASVMTVTTADIVSGTPAVGQLVTGGTLPPGTYIASSAGTGSGTTLWNLANADGTAIPNQSSFTVEWFGVQESQFTLVQDIEAGASVTASIAAGGIMTVTAIGSGTLEQGQFLTDTAEGLLATASAQILYQITGTAGGEGTYQTSYPGVINSGTVLATSGQSGKFSSWATA